MNFLEIQIFFEDFYISGKAALSSWNAGQTSCLSWSRLPMFPSTNFAKIGKLNFSGRSTLRALEFQKIKQHSYKYYFRHTRNIRKLLFYIFSRSNNSARKRDSNYWRARILIWNRLAAFLAHLIEFLADLKKELLSFLVNSLASFFWMYKNALTFVALFFLYQTVCAWILFFGASLFIRQAWKLRFLLLQKESALRTGTKKTSCICMFETFYENRMSQVSTKPEPAASFLTLQNGLKRSLHENRCKSEPRSGSL